VHELYTLLASFRGGNPASVAVLREKLASLNAMPPPDQRLIGYRVEMVDESREGFVGGSVGGGGVEMGSPYSESIASVESSY
jgi:hypothetical protein